MGNETTVKCRQSMEKLICTVAPLIVAFLYQKNEVSKLTPFLNFFQNHLAEELQSLAKFHPSETMQDLIDLLGRVVERPEILFYVYTTPPKQRMADMSMSLYKAGFVPGAIVYFSYDGEIKIGNGGQFLKEEIMGLTGLELMIGEDEQVNSVQSAMEAAKVDEHLVNVTELKPASKKPVKPKRLRL